MPVEEDGLESKDGGGTKRGRGYWPKGRSFNPVIAVVVAVVLAAVYIALSY